MVMVQKCYLAWISNLNSTRLINNPITVSWMVSSFEKHKVLRAKRLIQVRQLRFLRSIFWVLCLPILCSSTLR